MTDKRRICPNEKCGEVIWDAGATYCPKCYTEIPCA